MDWYYFANDAQQGPVSDDEFQALIADGTISSSTLVWNASLPEWVEYQAIAGSAPAPEPISEPTPEPTPEPVAEPERPKSSLKLASAREEEPAASAPAEVSSREAHTACSQCEKFFPDSDLIEFEGLQVCVDCKPGFFARVRESGSTKESGRGTGGATGIFELMRMARAGLSGRWWFAIGTNLVMGLAYLGIVFGVAVMSGVGQQPVLFVFIPIGMFLVLGPMLIGLFRYFLNVSRGDPASVGMLFSGFQRFGRNVGLIFIAWLVMVLVMVGVGMIVGGVVAGVGAASMGGGGAPGAGFFGMIVAIYVLVFVMMCYVGYAYLMAFFAAADNDDFGVFECTREGWRLIKGKRWKLFSMHFMLWLWIAIPSVAVMAMGGLSAYNTALAGGQSSILPGGMELLSTIVLWGAMLFWYPYFYSATSAFYDDLKD